MHAWRTYLSLSRGCRGRSARIRPSGGPRVWLPCPDWARTLGSRRNRGRREWPPAHLAAPTSSPIGRSARGSGGPDGRGPNEAGAIVRAGANGGSRNKAPCVARRDRLLGSSRSWERPGVHSYPGGGQSRIVPTRHRHGRRVAQCADAYRAGSPLPARVIPPAPPARDVSQSPASIRGLRTAPRASCRPALAHGL